MHGKNSIHVAEVDRYAPNRSVHLTFERSPDSEWNNGDAVRPADTDDLLHLFGVLRIDDSIGRLVGDPGDGIAMLLAHGLRGDDTVAEGSSKLGNHFPDRRRISGFFCSSDWCHYHAIVLCYVRETLAEDRVR